MIKSLLYLSIFLLLFSCSSTKKEATKEEKKRKYIIIYKRKKTIPNYSSRDKSIIPRMWSNTQSRHAEGYRIWAGLKSKESKPAFG